MRGYTTIQQSKRLVELGLNWGTADMYYPNKESEYPLPINALIENPSKYVACWSVNALLERIPKSIVFKGKKYFFNIDPGVIMDLWYVSYCADDDECHCVSFSYCEDLINSLYEIVVWLLTDYEKFNNS